MLLMRDGAVRKAGRHKEGPNLLAGRIGRLALRGAAIAIEVAIDIAPGNRAVVTEKAAEAAPEVRDVWESSGNRAAVPPLL